MVSQYYACRLPVHFDTPFYISSSQSHIEVGWTTPGYNGGCSILGYHLFIMDNSDTEIEVTSMANTDSNLFSFTVDLSLTGVIEGVVGQIYRLKIRAYNQAGHVDSNYAYVALASLPSKPTSTPTSDSGITNTSTLAITIDKFTETSNGGSEITLYEILYDDGMRGDYTTVHQLSENLVVHTDIISGASFRVKYRAKNFNGWGPLSDVSFITAATTPQKPYAPIFVDSDSQSISFMLTAPENESGSPITQFKLYADTLSVDSNY